MTSKEIIKDNVLSQMHEQYENAIKETLYDCFYVHPHDRSHICTDAFDVDGQFDRFVDQFVERVKDNI